MIITIGGAPGSGKSTVAKEVANRLGMKHYSMGDFQREIAEEKGLTLAELNELEEQDKSIDIEVDKRQKRLGEREDNFVIDSRLGFHFIPKSIKIFLDVDLEVGAQRILNQGRNDEEAFTRQDMVNKLAERIKSEMKRYKEYYNVNHYDKSNYDYVIDTTNLTIEEEIQEVLKAVKKHI